MMGDWSRRCARRIFSTCRAFTSSVSDLPDIGDHLIHFTGRTGGRMGG